MRVGERVERLVDEVAERLGVFELLELLHALLMLDAIGLHLRDCAVLDAIELPAQDQLGFSRIDSTSVSTSSALRRGGVELRQRLDQVERQRLVHREVVLKVHVDAPWCLVCPRDELNDAARDERSKELPRALPQRRLYDVRFVTVPEQPLHRDSRRPSGSTR